MTQSRSRLKSYFITGATPSEVEFAELIDSTLLAVDLVDSLKSDSTSSPLSANAGRLLNQAIGDIDARVLSLESAGITFAGQYYDKEQIDHRFKSVDTVISRLPDSSSIRNLESRIDNIKVTDTPSPTIENVPGLKDELEQKATKSDVRNLRSELLKNIVEYSAGGADVDLSPLNLSIAELTDKLVALEQHKAPLEHTHDVYTRSEVDAKIGAIDVTDHIHSVSQIEDLGQEIQSKTNLLVSDHSGLTNNPHNVTKEQIGLGKVQNLTPDEIVGYIKSDGLVTNTTFQEHIQTTNPHGLTKDDIGLGQVSNVDAVSLLDAHLSADNPHNIDLSFFDVYATAEADARTEFFINAFRYRFTPSSSNDSAGKEGDFAYDQDNLYFKVSDTEWKKVALLPIDNG
jgi:hypothetical protein